MERRKSQRIDARGDIGGRMILAADLDIQDLSLTGVRFTCVRRVVPGSNLNLLIHKDNERVQLEGNAVRSTLMGSLKGSDTDWPLYEVAVSFNSFDSKQRVALERIMQLIGKK